MKYFIYLFVLLLNACSAPQSKKETLVNTFSNRYVKAIGHQERISVIGTGGAMMYEIKKLNFYFVSPERVNLPEARQVALRSIGLYLSMVNQEEELKPYMENYPFTVHNLQLIISFNTKGVLESDEIITDVTVSEGILYYNVPHIGPFNSKTIHKETYEEALRYSDNCSAGCL